MSPTSIAAYVVLFGSVGLLFLLLSLLIGRLVRADVPTPGKLDAYECGEPAVGSSFLQFDLRFYVVALVFIIFEVEVTLFFPPATIFGTATRWMNPPSAAQPSGSFEAALGVPAKGAPAKPEQTLPPGRPSAETADSAQTAQDARKLALAAAVDLAAFFALILLGFAYVWRRGDLDWVRAIDTSRSGPARELPVVRSI